MSNPWFRLYKEFAADPVIQSLSYEDQRHYVVLLCLKCDGIIDRKISRSIKEKIIYRGLGLSPEKAQETKKNLIEFDLIDEKWQIKGWDKRQFISDHSTQRARKSRKSKETCNGSATTQGRDCNAPDTDTDTDTDTEQNKELVPTVLVKTDVLPPPDEVENSTQNLTTQVVPIDPVPYEKILGLYHKILPELCRVVKLTTTRKSHIRARWKNDLDDLNEWDKYFHIVRASPFLMGKVKPLPPRTKAFVADLDFLINETNAVKICEGKYHG